MSVVYRISPYRFLMNRRIKAFAGSVSEGAKILEIGAGPVSYKSLFRGSKVVSVDIVEGNNVDEIGDVTNLKYRSSVFDVILCFNVLEHVYDYRKAVSEMYRVLKLGGCAAIIVPFLYPVHDPPGDFYRFTEYSLERMLSGFADVKIDPVVLLPFGIFRRFVLFYFVTARK